MTLLYAQYTLDSTNLIKEYCKSLLNQQWDFKSSKIFRVPNDAPFMHDLNLELKNKNLSNVRLISIFCRGSYDKQIIHRDTSDDQYTICLSGFYIPLININSRLVWFDPSLGIDIKSMTPPSYNSNTKRSTVLKVVYNGEPIIGEYSADDPVIINTEIPHRAETKDGIRAAISIRLKENIDLFKHFKIYQ